VRGIIALWLPVQHDCSFCKIADVGVVALTQSENKRAAPKSRPFHIAEARYFLGFTLDLMEIEPTPSRFSTSAVPVNTIPPTFVTPTCSKSASEAVALYGATTTESASVSPFGGLVQFTLSCFPLSLVATPLLLVPVRYAHVPAIGLPDALTVNETGTVLGVVGESVPLMPGGGLSIHASVRVETVRLPNLLLGAVLVVPPTSLATTAACSGAGVSAPASMRLILIAKALGPHPSSALVSDWVSLQILVST
jgi:hypothetical protein